MNKASYITLMGRGAVGGALGGFVLLLVSVATYLVTQGHVPYPYLFVIPGLPLALGFGCLMGAAVGTVIWTIGRFANFEFGSVGRAVIGFVFVLIVMGFFALLSGTKQGLAQEPISWTRYVLGWGLAGVVLGVLPALLAKSKGHKTFQA